MLKNIEIFALFFCLMLIIGCQKKETGVVERQLKQEKRDNEAKSVKLTLNTFPEGAEVFVDGELIGKTSITDKKIKAGFRKLEIKKEGYVSLNLEIYSVENQSINLGSVNLFTPNTTLNIWKVGSPHENNLPQKSLSLPFLEIITKHNFRVEITVMYARDFSNRFLNAVRENSLPEIIVTNNDLPIGEVKKNPKIKEILWRVEDSIFDFESDFVYFISTAKNFPAVFSLIQSESFCPFTFRSYMSLSDEKVLKELAVRIVQGILFYQIPEIRDQFSSQSLIRKSRVFQLNLDEEETKKELENYQNEILSIVRIANPKICALIGNERLAFVLVTFSCWVDNKWKGKTDLPDAGQQNALVVFVKEKDQWRILTNIFSDPPFEELAFLASNLKVRRMDELFSPPQLLEPGDGVYPQTKSNERFGNYVWKRSPQVKSLSVITEVVELGGDDLFEYRLNFDFPYVLGKWADDIAKGRISAGELAGGLKWWRVWSIAEDGEIAFSETWSTGR